MADQQTIMHKPEAPCLLIEDRVSVNQSLVSPVLMSTVGEYTTLTMFAQGIMLSDSTLVNGIKPLLNTH
jgi:hypothetical protein